MKLTMKEMMSASNHSVYTILRSTNLASARYLVGGGRRKRERESAVARLGVVRERESEMGREARFVASAR